MAMAADFKGVFAWNSFHGAHLLYTPHVIISTPRALLYHRVNVRHLLRSLPDAPRPVVGACLNRVCGELVMACEFELAGAQRSGQHHTCNDELCGVLPAQEAVAVLE